MMGDGRFNEDSNKKRKRKFIPLLLVLFLLAMVVVGAWYWYHLSEILRGRIHVREQPHQPLKVYAEHPTDVTVGQEFIMNFTVENPNPETIRGVLMLNISRLGIRPDHVRVSTDARYSDSPIDIITFWDPDRLPNSVVFIIRPAWIRYFYFTPGNNTNIVWLRIYFNHPGTYDYEVSVVWFE